MPNPSNARFSITEPLSNMEFSPGVKLTGSAELFSYIHDGRDGERDVMMILVALGMVAIIIWRERKRNAAADAAGLAAARVLSLNGVTGDPEYSQVNFWRIAS
jgi:hypothetical protein